MNVDITDVKPMMPSLEKLCIKGLRKDLGIEMSVRNTGVLIPNHKWAYRDGKMVDIEEIRG